MLRNILLPSIFILLSWGFWINPDFKVITAGVAIFLFGMLFLEDGFKVFTGGTLEKILQKSTNKQWKSILFGMLSTSIMQSSSLVSVITISFLSAGLIGLTQGIGIIFGANLGTTTGAWLIAGFGLKVKISAYALPMLVFGILLVFQKSKALKGIGYILAGLGFLFLGIHYMKEGFEAFKQTINLTDYAVDGYLGLALYASIGVFATVIMQSSHATLVLTITALSTGQISYDNALALAIGANIGTTITAIIGSLSANEQGKRLAVAHLVFNIVTGLIAILSLQYMMIAVDKISIYVGIAHDDYTLKLAVFHTLFNLVGVLAMLPFINMLVKWLKRFIRTKHINFSKPRFLNESAANFPDTAVQAVRNETLHVWNNAIGVIAKGININKSDILSDKNLTTIVSKQKKFTSPDLDVIYEQKIKGLYSAIVAFISKAGFTWEMEQSGEIHWLRKANQDIVEAIKDIKHLQKNLFRYSAYTNKYVLQEYNKIRVNLALVIRQLNAINKAESENEPAIVLEQLKLTVEEETQNFNQVIADLIRGKKIQPETATSLLNDGGYAYKISQNLINMGETLFIQQRKDISDQEKHDLLGDIN